jgi:hypothetical protein
MKGSEERSKKNKGNQKKRRMIKEVIMNERMMKGTIKGGNNDEMSNQERK